MKAKRAFVGALTTVGLLGSLILAAPVAAAQEPSSSTEPGTSSSTSESSTGGSGVSEPTAVDTSAADVTASEVSVVPVQADESYTEVAPSSNEQVAEQQAELASSLTPDQQEESNAGVARVDLNSDIAVVGVTWDSSKVAPSRIEIRTFADNAWSEWKPMGIEQAPDDVDPARVTKGSTDPMTLTNVDSIEVIAYGDADSIVNDVAVNVIDPRGEAPVENSLEPAAESGDDAQSGAVQEAPESSSTEESSEEPGSAPQSGVETPQDPATVSDKNLDLDGVAAADPASFGGRVAAAQYSSDGKTYVTGSNGLVINTRKGWNANESWRDGYVDENIKYQGAVIHHTAGSNNYTKDQVPGQIQGIYYYHAVTLEWGDVGYQLLVDKFGGVWEGRYGSLTQSPMGAQAYGANRQTFGISVLGDYSTQAPSAAAQDAVAKAIAWEFGIRGIKSTTGKIWVPGSDQKGRYIDVISGHRDVGGTACPGNAFYARIPSIRIAVANYMASAATPTTPTSFDPSNIISDTSFYNSSAMTEAEIQTFLNSAGVDCVAGSGATCLKNTSFATVKLTTLRGGCQPLNLTGNQSAAKIISETSKACGINPQVILATLQKEQSGLTQPRSADVWAKAMGNACPDGQACDASQGGFEKQVYFGADKLVSYRINPTWEQYVVDSRQGKTSTIPNNPDSKCGSQSFVIKNDATASLYMYTPYVGGSTVSGCSAIGAKSFWDIMNRWFPSALGSPALQYSWVLSGGSWYYRASNGVTYTGWLKDDGKWYYLGADGIMATGWQFVDGKWYHLSSPDGHMETGWISDGSTYYYLDPSSGAMATGWASIEGSRYYFDPSSGAMKAGGWITVSGVRYYLKANGAAQTGWFTDGGSRYYLDPSTGAVQTGWVTVGSSRYYLGVSGVMQTGWVTVSGVRYFLKSDGAAQTGWYTEGSSRYYFDANGAMKTGWIFVGTSWYYMSSTGQMQTGWVTDGGARYYLDANGIMKTGWFTEGASRYYLNTNGSMQTGWASIGNARYYFDANGIMKTDWIQVGAAWYYLDKNGGMQKGWYKDSDTWYYLAPANGVMQTGWQKINGNWYYLAPSGAMRTNWVNLWGTWYYLDPSSGAMKTGWVKDKNLWYYLNSPNGEMVTGWKQIGGIWYFMNSSGAWVG